MQTLWLLRLALSSAALSLALGACIGDAANGDSKNVVTSGRDDGGTGVDDDASATNEEKDASDETANGRTPDGGSVPDSAGPQQPDGSTVTIPDAGPDAAPYVANAKRLFATSTKYTGDLKAQGNAATGLDGGDALCNQVAAASVIGGKWKAWLSSSTVDAYDRIADVSPWYLVDRRTMVFANKAQLAVRALHGIDRTEAGDPIPKTYFYAWTGTLSTGRKATGTCADWTSASNVTVGGEGYPTSTDGWSDGVSFTCRYAHALYCFEQ